MFGPFDTRIPFGEIGATADRFEEVLEGAKSERPIQRFFTQSPWVLAAMHPHGNEVFPEFRFGSSYRADFVVLEESSAGTFVELVELESPVASLVTKDGQFAKSVRKALTQVGDWHDWLVRNPGTLTDSIDRGGLGIDELGAVMKTVYVGRRSMISEKFNELRRREFRYSGVQIVTYDRILSWLRKRAEDDQRISGIYRDIKPVFD